MFDAFADREDGGVARHHMVVDLNAAPHGKPGVARELGRRADANRSEEHTSELQSLMRISYAVFCLKKKNDLYTLLHFLIFLFHSINIFYFLVLCSSITH